MRTRLWRGYHGPEVRALIEEAWRADDRLLVLAPPQLSASESFAHLPTGEVEDFDGRKFEHVRDVDWPDRPVFGLFTSGTARGEPRLVFYSKSCVRASLDAILRCFDPRRIDAIFCYPQPFHVFGLLLGYVLGLERGWPVFTGEGKYARAHHDARLAATSPGLLTLGTPTHFSDLRQLALPLSPSYSCIVGGAPVSVAQWRQLRDELKIEAPSVGYGASEASPGVTHLPAGREPLEDGEVGFPLPGVELDFVSEGYAFRGPNVCLALAEGEQLTFPTQVRIADELARREDGRLVFRGRLDLVLNRGGVKIPLERIEQVLARALGVRAAAFAVADARLGQELGVLIEDDGRVNLAQALGLLRAEFGCNFTAAHARIAPRLPLGATGKVDRRGAHDQVVS